MRTALIALLVAQMAHPPAAVQVQEPVHVPAGVARPTPGRPPIFIPRILPPIVAPRPRIVIAPRPRTGKGAVVGALAGAGFGAVLGFLDPMTGLKRRDAIPLGMFAFGGLGAFVGHQFDF